MASGRSKKNQDRLMFHGTHQLLVYANDVNMLGKNINTIKKNTSSVKG
jgi:hypothetical protein